MINFWSAVGILLLLFWMSFPVSSTYCESLYKWRSESGSLCYSNVTPPEGEASTCIILDSVDEAKAAPVLEPGCAQSSPETSSAPMTSPIHVSFDSPPPSLSDRILERELEISNLEQRLRNCANDDQLRKRLLCKKRRLIEELKYTAESGS